MRLLNAVSQFMRSSRFIWLSFYALLLKDFIYMSYVYFKYFKQAKDMEREADVSKYKAN